MDPNKPASNPYAAPPPVAGSSPAQNTGQAANNTSHHQRNIVTDTVIGPNVRKSDNLFQIYVILGFLAIFAPIGAYLASSSASPDSKSAAMAMGALAGGLAALIVGVISSGAILMVYRLVQHLRGKHD
jgi:hypothetical protein